MKAQAWLGDPSNGQLIVTGTGPLEPESPTADDPEEELEAGG